MSDMRLIVAGAGGRMGRTLVRAIAETPGLVLSGAMDAPGTAVLGEDAGVLAGLGPNGIKLGTELAPLLANADGVIDFTVPAASVANAMQAAEHRVAHIIGTTGFSAADDAIIAAAAKRSAIVKSGNMSLGVNLLAALVQRVAQALDDDFDIEIVEMHHNKKIDAPSGTALMFGRAAAAGRNVRIEERSQRGRDGVTGARKRGDIGFASLRGGTVVGDHTVVFANVGERVELTHKASSRDTFAGGAVRAARWLADKPAGLYDMQDVMGLK